MGFLKTDLLLRLLIVAVHRFVREGGARPNEIFRLATRGAGACGYRAGTAAVRVGDSRAPARICIPFLAPTLAAPPKGAGGGAGRSASVPQARPAQRLSDAKILSFPCCLCRASSYYLSAAPTSVGNTIWGLKESGGVMREDSTALRGAYQARRKHCK